MARVTQQDIATFNELYYKYKTYAEVARRTGFSAGTVSKYVDKKYIPAEKIEKKIFDKEINDSNFELLADSENWGRLLALTAEEQLEITDLWKELSI